jgi:hypothetical protein
MSRIMGAIYISNLEPIRRRRILLKRLRPLNDQQKRSPHLADVRTSRRSGLNAPAKPG